MMKAVALTGYLGKNVPRWTNASFDADAVS
ncbi:hypothetical protein AZE42_04626, partial [Rhizopogon vesiculosus]